MIGLLFFVFWRFHGWRKSAAEKKREKKTDFYSLSRRLFFFCVSSFSSFSLYANSAFSGSVHPLLWMMTLAA